MILARRLKRLYTEIRTDWRGWIARKLLGLANRVDPECKAMYDFGAGWVFRRGQKQPVMDEELGAKSVQLDAVKAPTA